MLLLHQIGSVKIGEIVRYSVTYTPAHDRILPAPEYLYLRIRNTSNSALRAAFVHGPYNIYVDAYPAHFDPNEKFAHPRQYGVPEFEPMLKAGGTWTCRLIVPESIRHGAGSGDGGGGDDSVSWIINVSSQVIFSTSAAVHYEVLLARDPKSLELGGGITSGMPVLLGGSGGGGGSTSGNGNGGGRGGGGTSGQALVLQPGKVSDYQRGRDGRHPDQPKGVFSRAVQLQVEDTAALWNKPQLPGWKSPPKAQQGDGGGGGDGVGKTTKKEREQQLRNQEQQQLERQRALEQGQHSASQARQQTQEMIPGPRPGKKQKKIHLVVLTHGLHSNLGGDMLYIKESIDVAVQQAKIDRKERLARERAARAEAGEGTGNGDVDEEEDDDDDEEVVVRGYSGNATRTERGIKYLGKRLARYVMSMTYPDQPYLPSVKAAAEKAAVALHGGSTADAAADAHHPSHPAHKHSTIQNVPAESHREYKFTKISFIAHSLGGLVQTYAVAYIQKHSPQFFDLIEPVNFIGMASPFLGLNHENPLYVKFALDFGLVGRTGQDLGLTWRAPTIARSGWGALVGNLGDNAHKKVLGEAQPESKPLLRILPTGPAHTALKKFRNRTVYSNVVNDGIVPLRTSCLLFLDWQGLDRVEKARREAGLVETVMGFGWAELVGNNVTTPRGEKWEPDGDDDDGKADKVDPSAAAADSSGAETPNGDGLNSHKVPQPSTNATQEDDRQSLRAVAAATAPYASAAAAAQQQHASPLPSPNAGKLATATTNNSNPFTNFFNNLFKSGDTSSAPTPAATAPGSPQPAPRSEQLPFRPPSHTPTGLGSNHNHNHSNKQNKIYQRSQTLRPEASPSTPGGSSAASSRSRVTTGHELASGNETSQTNLQSSNMTGFGEGVSAPPRTSFFESATDIINPKLPSVEFLIDPSKRPRAIFHDRVYHPTDIPAPPLKRRPTGNLALRRLSFQQRSKTSLSGKSSRSSSPYREPRGRERERGVSHQDSALSAQDYDDPAHTNPDRDPDEVVDSASIKVEEKIARAYHRDLSWRKVLVKLEPDAHNNMVVRRMFANAFGWPVVKHMVDAHFSDSAEARMRDEDEDNAERARPLHEAPDEHGAETRTQEEGGEGATPRTSGVSRDDHDDRGAQEARDAREAEDKATDLPEPGGGGRSPLPMPSATWSDRDWNDSGDESDAPAAGADDDHLAYGGAAHGKGVPSGSAGVSVTATAGTTTGPLPPRANLASNPLADQQPARTASMTASEKGGRPSNSSSSVHDFD